MTFISFVKWKNVFLICFDTHFFASFDEINVILIPKNNVLFIIILMRH